MNFEPGEMLSHYRLGEKIGEGGMGVVWKAEDTALDRDVAIKFLPDRVAQDAGRLARFEREAKLLAALNHSNVGAIYGIEHPGGGSPVCLVLEYVPGETLDGVIARGPLALEDALEIAEQIAEGLEAAHEAGIVHRDLKPANVKITPTGRVKVLDFGLAKDTGPDVAGSSLSPAVGANSPTISTGGTRAGVILGTAAFMSPEQARGKPVDRRTDIWALGCILFECLTGAPAFSGETITDVLGAILHTEPDWSKLSASTPLSVRDLLRRCLEKDAKRRLRDIGDARIELQEALARLSSPGLRATATEPAPSASTRPRRRLRNALWIAAGGLGWLVLAVSLWESATGRSSLPAPHVSIVMPSSLHAIGAGVSPDGSFVGILGRPVGEGSDKDPIRIYIRPIDRFDAKPLRGTESAVDFKFSPDSRWVAFRAPIDGGSTRHRLMRVPVDGTTPPQPVCDWDEAWDSFVWAEPEYLLVSVKRGKSLVRVPSNGGPPGEPVAVRGVGFQGDLVPQRPLPGGRAVFAQALLYGPNGFIVGTAIVEPATGNARLLIQDGGNATYVETGHVLYTRGDTLLAAPFDLTRMEITGPAVALLDGIRTQNSWSHGTFSVSLDGTLMYRPGGRAGGQRSLALVAPSGRVEPLSDARRAFEYSLAVSRDGSRVAAVITNPHAIYEIWISDLDRPALRKLVAVPGADCGPPVWSPDGAWLAYNRIARNEEDGIYVQPLDDRAPARRIAKPGAPESTDLPTSWSPDGSSLLVTRRTGTGTDVVVLPLTGPDREADAARPLFAGPANEIEAAFSPDGRAVAYTSDESGRAEVYIAPYRKDFTVGPVTPVSSEGGRHPVWSADGKRLYFVNREGQLLAAPLAGAPPRPSAPAEVVIEKGLLGGDDELLKTFDVLPDGRVLFVRKGEEEEEFTRFDLIFHWLDELPARMAGTR